jgi:glycosyltransferase involved in cell wall biosynthesis
MPAITILLPVYNGAAYLKESIDSVLAQDYRDFELHIIDDMSADQSPAIARTTGDSRVRHSRNPERYGLFKTLNRGFEEADKSAYVRIWAQDDRMLPGSLKSFVNFARAHPSAGMFYCDYYVIDHAGSRSGAESKYLAQRGRTPAVAGRELSALLFWLYGCLPGNISTVMLRRDAWEKIGGFVTGFQQAPDYEMWVRLSEHHNIGFISEKAIELREHSGQLGKLGEKELSTIEEELIVVNRLRARLASILTEKELNRLWRTERGRQHIHWIVRALLRGEWSTAKRGWQSVKLYGQPWSQALFWLVSLNGRLFMPARDAIFDRLAPLLTVGNS